MYIESRKNKDTWGNNAFHYCYEVDEKEKRDKMLELLITEDVGNPLKLNNMGMAPHMIDHRFDIEDDIPE